MKKAVLGLTSALGLGLASGALADSWGPHILGIHYTIDNTFGSGTGLRIAADVPFYYDFAFISGQLDAMLGRVNLDTANNFSLYYGGGAHVGFYISGKYNNGIIVGPHVMGGLEYKFTPSISSFFDVSGGVSFNFGTKALESFGAYYGGMLGVNFKL